MNGWKITAMIFIGLFLVETSFLIWSVSFVLSENKKDLTCNYDVCNEYPYAERDGDVCYCYDYDMFDELQIVKTELMK